MKAIIFNLTALAVLCAGGRSSADVIYSNLQDLPINLTWSGTTIDLDGVAGWEFNPYLGGSYLANSGNFQPARVGTDGMDTVLNLSLGSVVNGGLNFATGSGGSLDHLGSQFTAGTEGYFGFKLNGSYGWMRVVFTNNTSGAMVKDWAYDTSATSITIGRVNQSAPSLGTQLVTLSPQTAESFSLGSQITDTGGNVNSLLKTGGGTTILTGNNTYTGTTTVSGGTLAVNGALANTTTTIGNTGRLQGSGSIGGSVTVQSGGTIGAGNSIESLATGALSLESGSIFEYEMNNDAAANLAGDLTAVTGTLTLSLDNLATLTLAELGSGSWSLGDKLTLISYSGSWNGGLFSYNSSTLGDDTNLNFSGTQWLFNYNDTTAGTNYTGDLTGASFVTMTAVVPEPRAALLGGLGLIALLRRRR